MDAVNAAMAGIQATSRLDGDSILTKRLGIASGVVGLLSLAVKKKPLELGDYFTAASTVISFLGSLGLRLSPLGAVYNSNLPPLQGEARSGGRDGEGVDNAAYEMKFRFFNRLLPSPQPLSRPTDEQYLSHRERG